MRVLTATHEFTLYIEADGAWTMHVWRRGGSWDDVRWTATYRNINEQDPFVSSVVYDAWR